MLCTPKVTHIQFYKTRLNGDVKLIVVIDFAELITLNLINNVAES